MQKFFLLLACLTFAVHGVLLESSTAGISAEKPKASKMDSRLNGYLSVAGQMALARFLLASSPAAGFNPTIGRGACSTEGSPACGIAHTRVGDHTPRMFFGKSKASVSDGKNDAAKSRSPPRRKKIAAGNDKGPTSVRIILPWKKNGEEASVRFALPWTKTPAVEVVSDTIELSSKRRSLITVVALAGAAETIWLTLQKLGVLDDPGFCTASSCLEVLGGPYGTVAGVPLSLPGSVAYFCVALLSQWPRFGASDRAQYQADQLLVAIVTAQAVFSAYLMWLLAFVIKAPCPYCITSAVFSATQAALVWWRGGPLASKAARIATGAGAAVVSTLLSAGLFFSVQSRGYTGGPVAPYKETVTVALTPEEKAQNKEANSAYDEKRSPKILKASSPRAIALAKKLNRIGAKMYGAYWCGNCYNQKLALGKQAMELITYIECGKDALVDNNKKLCEKEEIKGYPTWEIKGQKSPGRKSIEELENFYKEAVNGPSQAIFPADTKK